MIQQKTQNPVVLTGVTNAFGLGLHEPLSTEIPAQLTFIVGESGIGKTTLLHIIGGLLRPKTGSVQIHGKPVPEESDPEYQRFRRESVVMLHQDRNLIEHMTVEENVALSLIINRDYDSCEQEVSRCLERVGLSHKSQDSITNLSGGERQRVAIARAMASKAPVVLADEPTGSLDPVRSRDIMELLAQLAEQDDKAVIVVTHDHELAHDQVESGSGQVLQLTRDGLDEAHREADPEIEFFGKGGARKMIGFGMGGLQ